MGFNIRYPLSGSNPSVGGNGTIAPTSATLVGGIGPDTNLHPLSTDNFGVLNVNATFAPGDTVIANQGTPAILANAWPIKVSDGVNFGALANLTAAQELLTVPAQSQIMTGVMLGWDGTNHRELAVNTLGTVQVLQPDTLVTGNITSNQSVTLAVNGLSSAGIQVTGVWTGTLTLESSVDGVSYAGTSAVPLTGGTITSNLSANNIVQVNLSGMNAMRVRGNTVSSGTAVITIRGNATTGPVVLSEPLPNGGNTIGNVGQSGAPWSMNQTQVGGVAVTLGQKVSASSYPVVIASDQSSFSLGPSKGRSLANAPVRNDYTITPVTTGAFVQLVASTSNAANMVEIFDSSGQTMAFAVGGAGSEVIQFYIFPGGNGAVSLNIPVSSRISVKAISATASVGELDVNFYT